GAVALFTSPAAAIVTMAAASATITLLLAKPISTPLPAPLPAPIQAPIPAPPATASDASDHPAPTV
ncbi:hypothetical protein LZ495_42375, partial [Yinghuangia sp. KLBMP8922]|nr:hypothetical protein [Yinghuangia soli]